MFPNFLSSDVLAEKLDTTGLILSAIASKHGGIKINSFKDLQTIIRAGLAKKFLAIGDQISWERTSAMTVTKGNSQSGTTGITAVSVDRDSFLHAVGTAHNGNYEFYWDGAVWLFNNEPVELSAYGITASGTPALGDEIVVHETASTVIADVIGIDEEIPSDPKYTHSVTLQLHDCFTSLQFDEREALFYAESAMPAGTYHFTLREQSWYAADVNKTFEFTLTQALAAGSQICVTNAYNAAITSGKVKTYSGGMSTTAIETVDITEGNGGTDLGDVRNALVGQNTNSIQRALLGSNNWANSAMRQWLNSSAAAGSVWTPKTKFDRPPSWVSSIAGFLNGMDEDFVKAVGTVKKTTALNTVTDGGGKVESDERFFLLSRSEVYGGNEVAGGEGAAYSYYADYSDLSGAGTGADTNRIKYRNNAVQYWWLRSPNVPYAFYVRYVNTTGIVGNDGAYISIGVAPACAII